MEFPGLLWKTPLALLILSLQTLLFATCLNAILLIDVDIPTYIEEGSNAKLSCLYEVEYDGLYSLKWYRNDQEFFSYIPRLKENSRRFFHMEGLQIDTLRTTDGQHIYLINVTEASKGEYKCQVSGEGPLFVTQAFSAPLRVAVIPKKPPKISGIPKSHYFELGEWVNLNCSSSPSKPPARLTWFVNGKVAKEYMTRRFKPSSQSNASSSNEIGEQDAYGTGPLGLEFWLHPQHFNHEGQVTVKCQAMIPKVYLAETRTHVIANQRLHNRADKVSRTFVLSYDIFLLIFLEWIYWNT